MPRYALLQNSTVVNIILFTGEGETPWSEDFQSLVIPDDSPVSIGWVESNGVLSAPLVENSAPPVPLSVTRAQAKLALLDAGLLDDVEQAIAGMSGDDARRASIEWNERTSFERQSPFLQQMAGLVGLDDAALDALFVDAASR